MCLTVVASGAAAKIKARADYVCDGTADEVQINAAIAALPAGGGKVMLAEGTFTLAAAVVVPSNVTIEGQGESTVVTRANSVNCDCFVSEDFATLTGTDSTGGPQGVRLANMILLGNKANNTAGYGIRKYGKRWILENLQIYSFDNDGIWSEWGTSAAVGSPGADMEDQWINVRVGFCDGDGIRLRGPHDTMMMQILTFCNGGRGLAILQNATYTGSGVQIQNMHSYGNTGHGFYSESIVRGMNIFSESNGGDGFQLLHSDIVMWNIFALYNTGDGIQLGDGSHACYGVMLHGKSIGNDAAQFNNAGANAYNFFMLMTDAAAGSEVTMAGSFHNTDLVFLQPSGARNTLLPKMDFPASASHHLLEGWVRHEDQNPTLGAIPANSVVLNVRVWVEEAFNSDGTDLLTVGYDADTDAYVTSLDVKSAGVQAPTMGASVGKVDATERQVEAYYVNGGTEPSTGKAHVIVEYMAASAEPS
jgi:hypothetical protein